MKRKDTGNKLKLGAFVAIGTLLFIIAIYMLGKQKNLFGTTFQLHCVVNNVSGLQIGNNVRYSGINVGTVENIQLMNDTTVLIDMVIESDVQKFIKKDSKAIIGSEGLMGNKLVDILPGSMENDPVKDGDLIRSGKPIDLNQILASLQKTGENIEHITADLAIVTHNVSHGKGTMGKILTDSVFAETLHQTLMNVERGTAGFSQNMEALKGNVLFRGYYKKKEKDQKKQDEARNKKKEDEEEDD